MSQHNIIGSEAFNRGPSVQVRSVRTGGMRRRRSRTLFAFAAGAAVALVGGVAALIAAFGTSLAG